MRRSLAVMLMCVGLAACELPNPWQYKVPDLAAVAPPGNLAADRQTCNKNFPPRVGNYLAHANCVNEAVERDAIPLARYPDLVRLQEQLRVKYSAAIDQGALSPRDGERRMREADELVEATIRDRDRGRATVAEYRTYRLQTMLQ